MINVLVYYQTLIVLKIFHKKKIAFFAISIKKFLKKKHQNLAKVWYDESAYRFPNQH